MKGKRGEGEGGKEGRVGEGGRDEDSSCHNKLQNWNPAEH